MGDTPSVGWLLNGSPDDPSQLGWGGQFVRAWERPYSRLNRMPTLDDQIEVFGVLELALPLGENVPEKPEAQLLADGLKLNGYVSGEGTMRFRFCPKASKAYPLTISSNVPALDGKTGAIRSVVPEPAVTSKQASELPNWWTDDPASQLAEGEHHGAKSVSRWREEFP